MPEQWDYYIAFIVQREEGSIGLSARPLTVDHQIDSYEILGAVIEGLVEEFFPDGPPELPDGLMPIVPLTLHLLTKKEGNGRKP
jgi:hypothetical protein